MKWLHCFVAILILGCCTSCQTKADRLKARLDMLNLEIEHAWLREIAIINGHKVIEHTLAITAVLKNARIDLVLVEGTIVTCVSVRESSAEVGIRALKASPLAAIEDIMIVEDSKPYQREITVPKAKSPLDQSSLFLRKE